MMYLMRGGWLAIVLACCLAVPVQGQRWKDALQKAKQKAAEQAIKAGADLMESGKEVLEARKKAMDTATYNYSVAMADHAGFYSNTQGWSKTAFNLSGSVLDPQAEPFEKAMDYNRRGEQLYRGGQYRLAGLQYFSALGIYSPESEAAAWQELNPAKKGWSQALMQAMISASAHTEGFSPEDCFAHSRTLDNLAQLMHLRGRYAMAERVAAQALALRRDCLGEAHPATLASQNNLGVLYRDMGRFAQAASLLDSAVKGHRKHFGPEAVPYALSLNNQALLLQSLGRYEEAKKLLSACLSILEKQPEANERQLAHFRVNLALLHQDLREYKEAKAIYEGLLERYRGKLRLGGSVAEAYVLQHAASLYLDMGQAEQAGGYLRKALLIYQAQHGTQSTSAAATLRDLSLYHRHLGNLKEAKETGDRALQIRERLMGKAHPDRIQSLEDLAVVYWRLGEHDSAAVRFREALSLQQARIAEIFPAMNEHEKSRYWEHLRPSLMLFYNFAADQGKQRPELLEQAYDWHLKTKGLLLSASEKIRRQILNGTDEALRARYLAWIDQKEQLALYYGYTQEALAEEGIRLDSLEEAAKANERLLAQQAVGFGEAYRLPAGTFAQVKQALKPGQAAVEIIRLQRFGNGWTDSASYLALVALPAQKHPAAAVLEGTSLETQYAKFYRSAIAYQIEDEVSYEKFWQPIAALVQGVKTLYLSLDGIYTQLNVSTLRAPDGRYVLEMHDVHLLGSTRSLLEPRPKRAGAKDALLLGFPEYGGDGGVPPLPGTAKEVAGIAKVLTTYDHRVQVFTEREASEGNFKRLAGQHALLHVATHGYFLADLSLEQGKVFGVSAEKAKENPLLRSGLMLHQAAEALSGEDRRELQGTDNGLLTAYEVAGLSLEGLELVVLSACETGLGEVRAGEGVYGLQRAFQVAGAEALLMSLWKVSDEATQELMLHFYQNWMRTGNKEQAFAEAQRQLKARYPEPYYWGAFVLLQ